MGRGGAARERGTASSLHGRPNAPPAQVFPQRPDSERVPYLARCKSTRRAKVDAVEAGLPVGVSRLTPAAVPVGSVHLGPAIAGPVKKNGNEDDVLHQRVSIKELCL